MDSSKQEKLDTIDELITRLSKIGYHFEQILDGFQLYDQYKGILDIEVYEKTLVVYKDGLKAMAEQINNLYIVLAKVKHVVKDLQ